MMKFKIRFIGILGSISSYSSTRCINVLVTRGAIPCFTFKNVNDLAVRGYSTLSGKGKSKSNNGNDLMVLIENILIGNDNTYVTLSENLMDNHTMLTNTDNAVDIKIFLNIY
uniref:hypothetical protein n=1 Tax=Agaricus bitorquis TaxID=5343 RepID=UPI00279C6400|nr:hypothetical protein QLP03_mgp003 [Agaricus bitorquis]WFG53993.1 hypothetical protein [Agaricus bitorquis]